MSTKAGTTGISRRDFLKGASAIAAATLLSGVTPAFAENATSEDLKEDAIHADYSVINTDILVIGGGNMGIYVARQAMKEGHSVAIIDKGVFRHNGTSGMNWEHGNTTDVIHDFGGYPVLKSLVVNGEAAVNAINFMGGKTDMMLDEINLGETFALRADDGSIDNIHCQFVKHHMDAIADNDAINIYDRVLITDIFVSNGVCKGVMGIYLPTGEFTVFRANAVVDCTGGCTWMFGWLGVSAYSNAVQDNTGDIEAALYRNGYGVINSEICEYDLSTAEPIGLATGFGGTLNVDSREPKNLFGVDGAPLLPDPDNPNYTILREYFTQNMARAIFVEKRGTEHDGALYQITPEFIETGRPFNRRNAEFLTNTFGVDLYSEPLEVIIEMYEKGGFPYPDAKQMTEIPGFFIGRNYQGRGFTNMNHMVGPYTGHCAAEYANNVKEDEMIDWSSVEKEYQRLQEIRTRKVENGIRPHVVRQAIQNAAHKGLGVYRTTEGLKETIAELRRIEKEDIPRMVLEDDSPIYSKEWKEAIENYNMLDDALLTAEGALRREESRGYCIRAEYPEQDDENFACWLEARKVDGEITFKKIWPPVLDETKVVVK